MLILDSIAHIDVVMPMYNLIEYSDNYSKTPGILWQFCRDVPAVDDIDTITSFTEANATTNFFSLKEKLTGKTGNNLTKNIEIMVPLKCPSNFWRTLEMFLINFEITLDLNWSGNGVIVATNEVGQAAPFSIIDTKVYVPVVNLSTQDNAKLFEQLKSGFKEQLAGINIKEKYQQKEWINI